MHKKAFRNAVVIFGALFLVGGYEIWNMVSENYPIVNFPPKGAIIVAFGDSLTEGIGATSEDRGYVPILEKRLGVTIINKGVRGDTTARALARIDDVLALKPNTVVVFLGGNDIIQRVPRETTFENLTTIIARLQQEGSVVLLVGLDGIVGHAYQKDFDVLAKKTGSLYVPNVLNGITGNSTLLADEVHPNDAGYLKIADRIAFTLEEVASTMPKGVNSRSWYRDRYRAHFTGFRVVEDSRSAFI